MLDVLALLLVLLALAIAVLLAFAATRPDRFRIARSQSIAAPADRIFPLIDDLRAMNTWNPFDKQDPGIKGIYSGPARGPGAAYDFASRKAGTGRIEIVDTDPPGRVTMRLRMVKPMAADNRVVFTLEPDAGATRVTWAMDGESRLAGKVMDVLTNCDRMVGSTFERGLTDLKALAEK